MQENNIENWIYFLRGLVRKATIGRKNNFRDTKEANICFDYELSNGRQFWELFKTEFREKKLSLNDIEKQNLYDDLKTEFYPYINNYFKWFNENKSLEKFEYFFIYQTFFEFCNDTKKEIERLKPEKDEAVKPVKTGFQSSLTDEKIQTLFELLKGKYIDINTNPDYFKAIFKNEPLPYGSSINWKKTKVLLSYFIKKFFHSDNYLNVWKKAENIFNVKDLQNSECNNPYPKGYKDIDIIHKNINTHSQ